MWKIRKFPLLSGLELKTARMIDEVLTNCEPQRLALAISTVRWGFRLKVVSGFVTEKPSQNWKLLEVELKVTALLCYIYAIGWSGGCLGRGSWHLPAHSSTLSAFP